MRLLLVLVVLLLSSCRNGEYEFSYISESDPYPFSVPLTEQNEQKKVREQQLAEVWDRAIKRLDVTLTDSLISSLAREGDTFVLDANVEITNSNPVYLGISDHYIVGEVTLYKKTEYRLSREVVTYILLSQNKKKPHKIVTTIRGWIEE